MGSFLPLGPRQQRQQPTPFSLSCPSPPRLGPVVTVLASCLPSLARWRVGPDRHGHRLPRASYANTASPPELAGPRAGQNTRGSSTRSTRLDLVCFNFFTSWAESLARYFNEPARELLTSWGLSAHDHESRRWWCWPRSVHLFYWYVILIFSCFIWILIL